MARPCSTGLPWVFFVVIDSESFSETIFRAICNVWTKINYTTFVTDVQTKCDLTVSYRKPEKLVCRSNSLCVCAHMYPRRSTRLDVYSEMYVKDEVCCTPWSGKHGEKLSSNDWPVLLFVTYTIWVSLLFCVMRDDVFATVVNFWTSWLWIPELPSPLLSNPHFWVVANLFVLPLFLKRVRSL